MPIPSPQALSWLQLALTPGRSTLSTAVLHAAAPTEMREGLAASAAHKEAGLPWRDSAPLGPCWDASLHWLTANDCRLLAPCDAEWPPALRTLEGAPAVLFAQGNIALLQESAIAVVGSRRASRQGTSDAFTFAQAFSETGLVVVSGMAEGIDAAAHLGALAGKSSTIAVMGTGPDLVYPACNARLHARLLAEGCVITEFPPGAPPMARHFPRRNRIISGLSLGVVVVEAARRSGSLITARLALDQQKDVYALPGSIHSPLSKGCHEIIREGAKLVEDVNHVLEDLGYGQHARAKRRVATLAVSPRQARVLDAIGYAPTSPDEVCFATGMDIGEVLVEVTQLEMARRLESLPGGRYRRRAES